MEEYLDKLKENIKALDEKEILSSIRNKYNQKMDREFNQAINKLQ